MLKKLFKWSVRFFLLALLCLSSLVACHYYHRPGLDDYAAALAPVPTTEQQQNSAVMLRWLGVTAIVIEDDKTRLFIDPFFSRPEGWWPLLTNQTIAPDIPAIQQGLIAANVDSLDAVLVSHSHFDHAMDAPDVAKLTRGTLLGSSSTTMLGKGAGLPDQQNLTILPNTPKRIGDFTITFFTSEHAGFTGGHPTGNIAKPLPNPASYSDYKQGGTFSILIEHPAGNLLHHGSAGFIAGQLDNVQADIILLGIAIRPELEDYFQETVDAVGASRLIPTHWDDFTVALPASNEQLPLPMPFGVSLDEFMQDTAAIRPELQVITLRINQPYIAYSHEPFSNAPNN